MTRKQEENIIKKIAKEITKEFPELKTKYEYDDIEDEWCIYYDIRKKDRDFFEFIHEKREEIENEGILVSIVCMEHKFRKELVEA